MFYVQIDKSVQRQLEYGSENDVNPNQKRNYGMLNITGTHSYSLVVFSKY